jgi:exodeoxyribonuclease VII large subunit
MVVPERTRLLDDVQRLVSCSRQSVIQLLQSHEGRLRAAVSSYGLRQPLGLIRQHEQRRDDLLRLLSLGLGHVIGGQEQKFRVAEGKLGGLSPMAVLQRGYSICRKLPEKTVVRSSSVLRCGDAIEISFAAGSAGGTVTTVTPE